MMKLHEAIVNLLEQNNSSLNIYEIAEKLNANNWYQKKDGSQITSFQIHGRTKNYSHLFNRNGTIVSLHNCTNAVKQSTEDTSTNSPKKIVKENITTHLNNLSAIEKFLMDEVYSKSASLIDDLVPVEKCGLYCIRLNTINSFPDPFKTILKKTNHNILYIGVAKKCLNKRLVNQELRIKGHGTFIRSLGAILGYRPLKGSLIHKKNKVNYCFGKNDNRSIIKWINSNLTVNWVAFDGDLENAETALINSYHPLLNIKKNEFALSELKLLRSECIKLANS